MITHILNLRFPQINSSHFSSLFLSRIFHFSDRLVMITIMIINLNLKSKKKKSKFYHIKFQRSPQNPTTTHTDFHDLPRYPVPPLSYCHSLRYSMSLSHSNVGDKLGYLSLDHEHFQQHHSWITVSYVLQHQSHCTFYWSLETFIDIVINL